VKKPEPKGTSLRLYDAMETGVADLADPIMKDRLPR
jgi:hypothetical protein